MPLQALCVGLEINLWRPQYGVVHSAFDRAVNLLMEGELWTVLAAAQKDAPFGIRLAPCDHPGRLAAKAADRVHVRAGYLSVGKQVVDCRTAARWAPSQWNAPARGLETRLHRVEQQARLRAWPKSIEIADDLSAALRDSDAALDRAVRRSVGRGPGLTPAGDDVLVGMLTVLSSGAAGPAAARAATRLGATLTSVLHSTSDISRHLLQQSARGLPGRALHDLGQALFEGAPDAVLGDVLKEVLDTGHTSGADACLGLVAACRLSFVTSERLDP